VNRERKTKRRLYYVWLYALFLNQKLRKIPFEVRISTLKNAFIEISMDFYKSNLEKFTSETILVCFMENFKNQ
jgi:hypothetical protein